MCQYGSMLHQGISKYQKLDTAHAAMLPDPCMPPMIALSMHECGSCCLARCQLSAPVTHMQALCLIHAERPSAMQQICVQRQPAYGLNPNGKHAQLWREMQWDFVDGWEVCIKSCLGRNALHFWKAHQAGRPASQYARSSLHCIQHAEQLRGWITFPDFLQAVSGSRAAEGRQSTLFGIFNDRLPAVRAFRAFSAHTSRLCSSHHSSSVSKAVLHGLQTPVQACPCQARPPSAVQITL